MKIINVNDPWRPYHVILGRSVTTKSLLEDGIYVEVLTFTKSHKLSNELVKASIVATKIIKRMME